MKTSCKTSTPSSRLPFLLLLLLVGLSSISFALMLTDSLTGKQIEAQISYTTYDFANFAQKNKFNPTSFEKKIEKHPPSSTDEFILTYPSEPCRVTIKTFEAVTCPAIKPKLWDGIDCMPRIIEFSTEVWEC